MTAYVRGSVREGVRVIFAAMAGVPGWDESHMLAWQGNARQAKPWAGCQAGTRVTPVDPRWVALCD